MIRLAISSTAADVVMLNTLVETTVSPWLVTGLYFVKCIIPLDQVRTLGGP